MVSAGDEVSASLVAGSATAGTEQTRQPTAVRLTTADGSRCEVDLTPDTNGTRTVREGEPTPLWVEIEHAYHQWRDWNEPGWDRFGVTISPQAQTVWLDKPSNAIGCVSPLD